MNWRWLDTNEAARLATERLGGATRTNYFRQPLPDGDALVCSTSHSLVALVPELDFHRLYFVTNDVSDLRSIAASVPVRTDVSVTHIHKTPESDVRDAFAGYESYAEYQRMEHRGLPSRPRTNPEFATSDDLDEVESRLHESFDRFTDHLPTREELATREVIVRRVDGRIAAFVVFVIEGAVCNFNYLFSDASDPLATTLLLNQFYGELRARGIRRGVLWANTRNTEVIRMHERFGWKADGVRASYYVRRA